MGRASDSGELKSLLEAWGRQQEADQHRAAPAASVIAMAHRHRGDPVQFFTNWREFEGPVAEKLALALRNRFIATALRRGCCGHPGEPGC